MVSVSISSLVPAPAVIPAPRAYINAVAVKGFVVELWAAKYAAKFQPSWLRTVALAARTSETKSWDHFLPNFRMQCMLWGARVLL